MVQNGGLLSDDNDYYNNGVDNEYSNNNNKTTKTTTKTTMKMNYCTPQQEVDWFPIWNILLKQVCIEIDFATKQICWNTFGIRQPLAEGVVKNEVVAWIIPWLFYLWLHLTYRLLLQSALCTQHTLLRLQPVSNQKIWTWHYNWNKELFESAPPYMIIRPSLQVAPLWVLGNHPNLSLN